MAPGDFNCKDMIRSQTCLVFRQIPPLPRSAIAAARRMGMAKTAQDLLRLRRALIMYKNAPCVACNSSDGAAIPQLIAATSQINRTIESENAAVVRAAMSNARHCELRGFVLSSPASSPVALGFTIPNTWVFLKTKFLAMFGSKALAVTCNGISSRIEKDLVKMAIEAVLLEVQIAAAAKQDRQ